MLILKNKKYSSNVQEVSKFTENRNQQIDVEH